MEEKYKGNREKQTEKTLENEFPKMRKEIPENETRNKYGNAARKIEIKAFMDMGAVERVHKSAIPPSAQILTGRFVYAIKKKPVEKESDWTGAHVDWDRKLDARLRIRGFLEDLDKSASAPTVCINTIRSIFSLVPVLGWDFRVLDISRAYLQSNDFFRTAYMKPPAQA